MKPEPRPPIYTGFRTRPAARVHVADRVLPVRAGVERIFATLTELGIGFVPYSRLGRGFLTGTAKPAGEYEETDMRRADPRWQPDNFEKNVEATRQLTELAESKGATVSQLALAWLLAQGEHIVPIPGTRSPKRIEENVGAADLTLTSADLDRIAQIRPPADSVPATPPRTSRSGTDHHSRNYRP
jgi:aryl-alcohol dehydrogenase-like predicted oxidoreductase